MGPYCRYCDHRCFVLRLLDGKPLLFATCPAGVEHDRKATGGHDYTNTHNPRRVIVARDQDDARAQAEGTAS